MVAMPTERLNVKKKIFKNLLLRSHKGDETETLQLNVCVIILYINVCVIILYINYVFIAVTHVVSLLRQL